ncbi:hypothetical protein KJ636_04490 [Patescibacteria group bacterium]|nr:hypothetical protein [Patescibacteria group bacterium]MBU4480854.1 hypothetical protein [Patescibacteria group bacterium]
MRIVRHNDIVKDLRNLRRFTAPLDSLEAWERLFCLKGLHETPAIDAFPGFGERKIYKARVVPLRENIGKSKGYRVVFQMIDDESCKILVFSRHGTYKSEQELINLVKERVS